MIWVDDAGNGEPARKATRFMTNGEHIAEAVERRWFGGHEHIQPMSGRAKACEKYPPRLVAWILRALPQEHARRAMRRGARADGTRPSVDDCDSGSWTDSRRAGAAVDP